MCFFNPKLKQTKVWQVELNRLNDRKKKKRHTHLCFHYKKVSKGMKKRKKKNTKKIVTNIK